MKFEPGKSLAQQFIDAYRQGAFPFLHAVHMEPLEIGNGTGSLRIILQEMHLRVGEIMHGGVATALLDTALGLAAATRAPKQHDVVTEQLNVHFVRAARIGAELIGEGTVLNSNRRNCVCRGEIRTASGELIAAGSATLQFVPMPLDDAERLLEMGQGGEED